jgi:MarR family transcriptional regulator, organic hydroperoxide resistance regulator
VTPTNKTETVTIAEEIQRLLFEIAVDQRGRLAGKLAELHLTLSQAHTLRLLDPERALPMNTIADRLLCDASNVTGIADRLEARGLIERRPSPGDRRIKTLALTDEGKVMRERVLALIAQPPPGVVALSEQDQNDLRAILDRAAKPLDSNSY